ncbi:MAG: DoxX family protein [Flexibacter sp. CG_4_10_14_3_um_filter_32_15]|nr:MAG: DoxX family protein [Flexibacter sp. CG_4_10_14_3_um_filter_32_15]
MKNKILFGVSLLFGLAMINGGLNKFFNYIPLEMGKEAMDLMNVFKSSGWVFNLVAIVEIIAGILIIIPKTRALAAIMIFPITIGITLFHVFQDPANLIMGFVFLAINLWIIFENKEKYMPMIS